MSVDARRPDHGHHEMPPVERVIRGVLLAGVVLSVALMVLGLGLGLARGEGLPNGVVPVADLPAALWSLDPAAFLSLGLIVLVATPFVRVAGSLVAFGLQRDCRYVLVTALVLGIMCLGLLLGRS